MSLKNVTTKRQNNNPKVIIAVLAGFAAVLAIIMAVVLMNFSFIRDIFTGMGYKPTEEMAVIFDKLELSDDGRRVFNASRPELLEREVFNQKCREGEDELAILGCFTEEKIYVYDILNEELDGIRELTTAHELLHAVYHRMGGAEKERWNEMLNAVYAANLERLQEELKVYPEDQKAEELYVRVGTEVKKLPEELERHYATIFKNQDKVVDYYESYISVFEGIQKKMEELLTEINELNSQVEAKILEYETRVSTLNAAADEFNECARTENCFTSSAVFNARRAELMAEQEALRAFYADINSLIENHNALVSEYNDNALHGQTLNKVINSSEQVKSD